MLVGVCSLEIYLPGVGSLKAKRRIINSIKQRVRNKFNVSIAEIADHDYWQQAGLGVACISNERRHLQQVLQQVINLVEADPSVEVKDYYIEML